MVATLEDSYTPPRCLHCKFRKQARSRGLCYTCYRNLEIRDFYPILRPNKEDGTRNEELKSYLDSCSVINLLLFNPLEPVKYLPGSFAKIFILMERASKQLPLFHPLDARL